jgi:hypothetical protein
VDYAGAWNAARINREKEENMTETASAQDTKIASVQGRGGLRLCTKCRNEFWDAVDRDPLALSEWSQERRGWKVFEGESVALSYKRYWLMVGLSLWAFMYTPFTMFLLVSCIFVK